MPHVCIYVDFPCPHVCQVAVLMRLGFSRVVFIVLESDRSCSRNMYRCPSCLCMVVCCVCVCVSLPTWLVLLPACASSRRVLDNLVYQLMPIGFVFCVIQRGILSVSVVIVRARQTCWSGVCSALVTISTTSSPLAGTAFVARGSSSMCILGTVNPLCQFR